MKKLFVFIGAIVLAVIILAFITRFDSPQSPEKLQVEADVPEELSAQPAAEMSEAQKLQAEIAAKYRDLTPGTIIAHDELPNADVYLMRGLDAENPLVRFVYSYERDIDLDELLIDGRVQEVANLLRVRLRQGVPAMQLDALAQSVGGAILERPENPFEDTIVIFADPSSETVGQAMLKLRAEEDILHALPVDVELPEDLHPKARVSKTM